MGRTLFERISIGVCAGAMLMLGVVAPASASSTSDSLAAAREARIAKLTQGGVSTQSADAYCTGRRVLDCWVHEPVVNAPQHEYVPIQFLKGDHVSIDAGGCVQTGGRGKTWKRYVDPASDANLYHGSIQIPGAINDLTQLWMVVGRSVDVTGDGGNLTLGYQDDQYDDNGYDRHDDGTGNQCKNVENAWVHLVIS
ncbi:MAG TPA: hypothetical protein VJX66_12285 [Amycolatopsis sp.]|nr:hypothetical protein [Amycolatopsis sp.]